MLATGRGSIAQIHYTGEEAAGEINKLLSAVVENEDEFERWEALVTRACELEGGVTRNSSPSAIELVRNVHDCFLAKFPLFFGYWKKYADLEFSIGGTETAEMVYERGVSCISSSVDLWTNYCTFKMETSHDNDIIRELFERGAHFVGLDFLSHPFWDKYIEFEERNQEPAKVTQIHRRVLPLPMYQFTKYYEKLNVLVSTRPIEELAEPEALESMKAAVQLANQGQPQKSAADLDRQLRTKIHEQYFATYTKTQQEVTSRWTFELAIKKPFFHVTEVEAAERDNWRKYLDFEEKQGDFERTSFLYERCLVACALYDEFWLRYARWMFSQGKEENARIIYMRASCIFVPITSPSIRLNWARFEEKLGRVSVARDIHLSILEEAPEHTDTLISLAGLERRHHSIDAAVRLLDDYIARSNTKVGGILAAEQARILWQCKGSVDEARQVFKTRHQRFLDSREFWVKYFEFEVAQPSHDQNESHARIKAVHDQMRTKGRFSPQVSKELSNTYMTYLLDCCAKSAVEEYMQLDMEINGYVLSAASALFQPPAQIKSKGQFPKAANTRQRK